MYMGLQINVYTLQCSKNLAIYSHHSSAVGHLRNTVSLMADAQQGDHG